MDTLPTIERDETKWQGNQPLGVVRAGPSAVVLLVPGDCGGFPS